MAAEVSTYMAQWKALLKAGEQKTTDVMAQEYAVLQKSLQDQLLKLAKDVIAVKEKGEEPTPGLLHQIDTYKHFQERSAQEFAKYIDWAGDVAEAEQAAAVKGATGAASKALDEKPKPKDLPMDADGLGEEVLAAWDQGAVEEIAGMTRGGPLKLLLEQGYGVAEQEIAQRLVTGVAKGLNAFEVANEASDALGIGLDRMLTIARTEMNRAFRESTMDAYRSSGVVERYARMSARDELVCESCLAADGDTFDVDIVPDDHPNCRCTTVPLIPGEEISDLGLTDSRAWFDEQPEDVQRGILGPGRLALYQEALAASADEATYLWDRLVSRRVDETWGPTLRPTTLKDLSKNVGGLPKDGGSTPGVKQMTKDLAPYPGKSAGYLGDLAPNDKLYKLFLETDEGAKAFMAAIDAALGLGPTKDEALIAKHVETVLAKDYKSAGALDYYLKTQGFHLNAEEKAEVKAAWKAQKAEQKAVAKAIADAKKAEAEAEAAKLAKQAEQKALIETFAKKTLEDEATTIAEGLAVLKSYEGGDAVYKQAFYEAFIGKFGMSPQAAEAQVAHAQKMAGALETLMSKDYKSPGAADYWLAHAGAQAFSLTGDEAKELKAAWAQDFKLKKAEAKAAKKAEAAIDYKKVQAAFNTTLNIDPPTGGGWTITDYYKEVLKGIKIDGVALSEAEQKATLALMGLGPKGAEGALAEAAKFPSKPLAEQKPNIMDAVKLKNDLLDASNLTMDEKVAAEKAANKAAQEAIDAGKSKAEMLAAVQEVIDGHIAQKAILEGVTDPLGAVLVVAAQEMQAAGVATEDAVLHWIEVQHPSWPQAWKDDLVAHWEATQKTGATPLSQHWLDIAKGHEMLNAGELAIDDWLAALGAELKPEEKAWVKAEWLASKEPTQVTHLAPVGAKEEIQAWVEMLGQHPTEAEIVDWLGSKHPNWYDQEKTAAAKEWLAGKGATATEKAALLTGEKKLIADFVLGDPATHGLGVPQTEEALKQYLTLKYEMGALNADETKLIKDAWLEKHGAGAKPALYDSLSAPAKMKADELLHAMADAQIQDVPGALAYLKGYAEAEGMSAGHQAAVLEKWATFTNAELPAEAKALAGMSKAEVEFLGEHVAMLLEQAEAMGIQVSELDIQAAKEAAWAAGAKEALKSAGEDWLGNDAIGLMIHDAMSDVLHDALAAPAGADLAGMQKAHLVETLAHDAKLAGVNSVGGLENFVAQTMPDLASTVTADVIKALQEAGQIPPEPATLPSLPTAVKSFIQKLTDDAVGEGITQSNAIAAEAKAVDAAKLAKAAGGTSIEAKAEAEKAFYAHLGGMPKPTPADLGGAAAAADAAKQKLEDAITTVLAKDYKSSGAVHYWLNSSQGANLSADEKKAVMKAWKEWKAGAAVDAKAEAAKFAGSHAAASTPAPAPTAKEPKLASGSKAKVDAAFQGLPIVAGYQQVMTQIDAMADLTAKEKAAVKQKWSIANAVSKSNLHPNMTVLEAKDFFTGLGLTGSAHTGALEEWGKLKGFEWKAQEKLELKKAAEQALQQKVATLAEEAFMAGAKTGPELDAYWAGQAVKPTQKEKAAIQKQVKALVKEEKAKELAALALEKAKAEAAENAAVYAKANEFITAKATLLQVEQSMKAEGATPKQVNKVKAAMRDIRKGGTAGFTTAPTVAAPFKMMGEPNSAKVKAFYQKHYTQALSDLKKQGSAGLSLRASRGAEDLQLSFVTKWTGGFYQEGGATFWNGGNYYKSETEFWNRFASLTGNTGASREKLEYVLAQMNKAMNRDEFRLRENTRLMRGFSGWNGEGAEMLKHFIDQGDLAGAAGKRFTMPSYMSSAVASKDWSWGAWTLNINAPAGMGGFPAQMVSGYKSEIEWLLPRNLTFEVREICYGKNAAGEGVAGRWNVFVDVVGKWDKDGRLIQDYSLPVKDDPTQPVRSGSAYEAAAKKAAADYVKEHPGESPVWLT